MAQRWQLYDVLLQSNPVEVYARHTKRLLRERPEPRALKWVRYDEHLQRIVDAYEAMTTTLVR